MTEGPAADGRYEREHAPGKAENRRGSVVVTRSLTLRGTRYRSASELSRVHELAELLVRCRWQADADLSDVRPHTRAAPCTQYYHPPFSLRPGDPQMQGRQAGSGGTGQSEASARRRPRRVGAQLFFFSLGCRACLGRPGEVDNFSLISVECQPAAIRLYRAPCPTSSKCRRGEGTGTSGPLEVGDRRCRCPCPCRAGVGWG